MSPSTSSPRPAFWKIPKRFTPVVFAFYMAGIVTASDAQLVQAMRFYAERMKMVVEPTGCLSLAGAEHGGVDIRGARVGILVSGGNVDMARFAELLGS